MSKSMGMKRVGASALVAAFALVGCGGGSSSSGPPLAVAATADSVPPSAAASVQGLVDYQKSLGASETTEAIQVQGFLAPTDETSEPFAI